MTEEQASGWRPVEGEKIEGKIIDLTRTWSDQSNSWYPIVVLKKGDGSVVNVHCFHYTLRTRLLDRQPKIGERLIITYHGKRKTKDERRTVAIYSVETPDTQIDEKSFWQSVGGGKSATVPAQEAEEQMEIPEIADDDIPF